MELKVSKEWLARMAKAEAECGDISVGGIGCLPPYDHATEMKLAEMRFTILTLEQKITKIEERLCDPDHPDELREDIANILGITLED